MSLRPHKGEQIPICDGGRQEAVWIYMSIPYCLQIHSTALGGSIFDLRFTPNRANWQRFSFIHRQKVVRLTPAASANSVLYALFMVLSFDCKFTKNNRDLQGKSREKHALLLLIVSNCFSVSQRQFRLS